MRSRNAARTAVALFVGFLLVGCTSPLIGTSEQQMANGKNTPDNKQATNHSNHNPDASGTNPSNDPRWHTFKMSSFASRPLKWAKDHKIDVCLRELVAAAKAAPNGYLFVGDNDDLVIENTVSEAYHAHLLTLQGDSIVADDVRNIAGRKGDTSLTVEQVQLSRVTGQRTVLMIVSQAYANVNPEIEALIPPQILVIELKDRVQMEATIGAQPFAHRVGKDDRVWIVPAPNTRVDQTIAMYSPAGRDIGGFRVVQGTTAINTVFRASLRSRATKAVHQKLGVYPFRPDVSGDLAGAPLLSVIDLKEGRAVRIPTGPRPKVWMSDQVARTEADAFASFYGLVPGVRYNFTTYVGHLDKGQMRMAPTTTEVTSSTKPLSRHIAMPTSEPVTVVVGHRLTAVWAPPSDKGAHVAKDWEKYEGEVRVVNVLDSPLDWITFLGPEDAEVSGRLGGMGYASLMRMAGSGPTASAFEDTFGTASGSTSDSGSGAGQGQGQGQGMGQGQSAKTGNLSNTNNNNFTITVNCSCGGGKNPLPQGDRPQPPGKNNGGYIPTPGGWSYPKPDSPVPYGPYGPAHAPNAPPYQFPGTNDVP